MIKIGRISYLNTEPFFYRWPSRPDMQLIAGTPRELALAAQDGQVDCAPLPLVECWRLEKDFEPLGDGGIAVREAAGSVLLFSKKKIRDLGGSIIGVTEETSTSVILLDVLLRVRHGIQATLRRGFLPDDHARLLIGDSALRDREKGLPGYPLIYDLGREWVTWQGRPFVFAQWVVRKSCSQETKRLLQETCASSLRQGVEAVQEIADFWSSRLSLSPPLLRDYLHGFSYELREPEREAMIFFRSLREGEKVS